MGATIVKTGSVAESESRPHPVYETNLGKMYLGKSEELLLRHPLCLKRNQVQLIFTSPPFPKPFPKSGIFPFLEVETAALGRSLVTVALPAFISPLGACAKRTPKFSHCKSPSYEGICDPYVPGTIIMFRNKKPILVINAWQDRPDEGRADREVLARVSAGRSDGRSIRMMSFASSQC